MVIVDDTLAIEGNDPASFVSNIPTDEKDAYLESTPNAQPSTACQQSLEQAASKPIKIKLWGAARKWLKLYLQEGISIGHPISINCSNNCSYFRWFYVIFSEILSHIFCFSIMEKIRMDHRKLNNFMKFTEEILWADWEDVIRSRSD